VATYSVYNNAVRSLLNGTVTPSTFTVRLYSAFTFNPATALVTGITATELPTQFGYTAGGLAVPNVVYNISDTNGCTIIGDNVLWTATGGDLTASFALVLSGSAPIGFMDFQGPKVAPSGTAFVIAWPTQGIMKFGPVVNV
jgi:hypothetical protein